MSLALLPVINFEAGLNAIQALADIIVNQYPRVLDFLAYMRPQWLPRAHIVSAYRCSIRTNNEVEGFNRQLIDRFLGARRNAFTFLGNYK